MRIKNINGTTDNTCQCESWLTHWKRYSGHSVPSYCPVDGCLEKELVGAHVQKNGSGDSRWYIYPLCKTHNASKGQSLEVSGSWEFVSANVAETCG